MCRLFVLLVCAHFLLSGGQVASLHTLDATQQHAKHAQTQILSDALSLTDSGMGGDIDLDNTDPLLVDLPPEVTEFFNSVIVAGSADITAGAYPALDLPAPSPPFLEGPQRPPRSPSSLS